ncbi:MAG: DUF4365 domain-containing protein [Acidobacteriia bacterium]|nr:DUF4365 domain-containing protein [Terriglobia bacterium]
MPLVSENRLKGNYGTALVMSRLSGECLVRPVAADTDVGVDLYCETVAEDTRRPFLHFWLQVKAGDQCKVDASAQRASCSFYLEQLDYWKEQPVPVFAALVPSEWPVPQEPDIYVIDVTSQILERTFSAEQRYVTLWSDYGWPAGERSSVQEFLAHAVPDTTARLQVSKGVIADVPTQTPQYVQRRPTVPALKFKKQILYQLRRTAACAILFSYDEGWAAAEDTEFRRLLAKIVEQFVDDLHWENFFSRAISSHADENYPSATVNYGRARQCIQDDPNVRDKPSWQEQVRIIEQLEQRAKSGRPLPAPGCTPEYEGS